MILLRTTLIRLEWFTFSSLSALFSWIRRKLEYLRPGAVHSWSILLVNSAAWSRISTTELPLLPKLCKLVVKDDASVVSVLRDWSSASIREEREKLCCNSARRLEGMALGRDIWDAVKRKNAKDKWPVIGSFMELLTVWGAVSPQTDHLLYQLESY